MSPSLYLGKTTTHAQPDQIAQSISLSRPYRIRRLSYSAHNTIVCVKSAAVEVVKPRASVGLLCSRQYCSIGHKSRNGYAGVPNASFETGFRTEFTVDNTNGGDPASRVTTIELQLRRPYRPATQDSQPGPGVMGLRDGGRHVGQLHGLIPLKIVAVAHYYDENNKQIHLLTSRRCGQNWIALSRKD